MASSSRSRSSRCSAARASRTKILGAGGIDLYGTSWFDLTGFWGIAVVYLYFQIPLMVLVTLPAIDGLKPAWREASSNLGGTTWTYWRRVGLPVLAPSMLGGFLLLFANAFSAFATTYALNTQSNLVPIKISFFLQGDVAGRSPLPFALATWMMIVMAVAMGGYLLLRQRAERWQRVIPHVPPELGAAVATEVVSRRRGSGLRRSRRRGSAGSARRSSSSAARCSSSLPLVSMARFALQNVPMVKLGSSTLFDKWSLRFLTEAFDEPEFWPTLRLSLQLALGTVAVSLGLLLPTALYVHLRLPRARAFVEFLTVLPYVVPPIALVAGVAAFFRPNAQWFLNSDYALIPFYVVMALPFTYRAIDAGIRAIDLRTLVDASRSLGAGWGTTLRRVLLPNLARRSSPPSFLTATVVLGEFTIADDAARRRRSRCSATATSPSARRAASRSRCSPSSPRRRCSAC